MKRLSLILIFIFYIVLTLTGCTMDGKEIDDQVYTLVIGADKGVDNKIRVTIQFPTYKSGGGGSPAGMDQKGGKESGETGEVGGTIVETIEAPSLLEAVNLLNVTTSRQISLVHTKTLVFSEALAREGIGDYLEPIARSRETRGIMQVVVCSGSAEDFIKENKTMVGESTSKAIELMSTQFACTGFFPRTIFQDFYKSAVSPYGQPFAVYAGLNDLSHLKPIKDEIKSPLKTEYELSPGSVPRKGDLKREYIGTAIFDGEKMVGSLSSYETRYFLLVRGEFQKGIFSIPDPANSDMVIPFDIRLSRKPIIKAYFVSGKPVISLKLHIEADIGAIQSRVNYEKFSKIDELNNLLETTIKNGISKTIEKTQKNWGTDIFGFGGYIARNFATVPEFEKYNWLANYKNARVTVEVNANVRRTGLMMGSSPIRDSKNAIISNGGQ